MAADWADRLCEIAECQFCDDQGIRLIVGGTCDHIDYGAIAKRGKAACLQALKDAKQ